MSKSLNKPFILKRGIKLPLRIFPGPMEGVMSPLFCRTTEDLNLVDFWMTPFLRITTGPTGKSKILKFTERFSAGGKPVIVQLMGTDIGYLIETALRCKELGFAGVNFNLACPSKQVLDSKCGGALLKDHKFIRELMSSTLELSKYFSVSLKIRTGLDSPDELEDIAESIINGNPDFIAVHFRTVREEYEKADGRITRIKKAVKLFKNVPVIANGDIDSLEDAERVIQKTGCAGVMVARGWLKNPGLLRDIQTGKTLTPEEKNDSVAKFISVMAENAQNNPREGDRNSMIDMASYIFERNHPFFEYIINTPFTEPARELSKEKIQELIK